MKRRYRALLCAALIVALAGAGAAWVRARQDTPGPILYTVPLSGSPAALVVDGRTERVFVTAARDGAGSVLDARTGALVGVMLIPGAALAVDERAGTVFAVGPTVVSMLDATNGRFLRQLAVGETPTTVAVDARVGHAFVVDPGSNAVYMLDTRTGTVVRGQSMVMTPALVAVDEQGGQALVTSGSPFVSVLDARSGASVRTAVLRASGGPLAVDGRSGHVFVLDPGGNSVAMLDMRAGLVLRRIAVGLFPVALAIDARRGRAYVVSRDEATSFNPTTTGGVSVLDTRTGAVLRTIPVGVDPVAVAVDEESGRVFVATRGGTMVAPDRWRWLPSWLRGRLPFLPPPGPHLRVTPPGVTAFDLP